MPDNTSISATIGQSPFSVVGGGSTAWCVQFNGSSAYNIGILTALTTTNITMSMTNIDIYATAPGGNIALSANTFILLQAGTNGFLVSTGGYLQDIGGAQTNVLDQYHNIYDTGGNLAITLGTANKITLATAPIITNGYFSGASVAKTAGSGDTTGTVSITATTAYTLQITYTTGSATTSAVDILTVTLASALPFTPNPGIINALQAGSPCALHMAVDNVTTSSFKLQVLTSMSAATVYVLTVCIFP